MSIYGIILLFFWPSLLFLLIVVYDRWENKQKRPKYEIQKILELMFIVMLFWKGLPMYLTALETEIVYIAGLSLAYYGFLETCLKYIIVPLVVFMLPFVIIAYVWSWFMISSDRLKCNRKF